MRLSWALASVAVLGGGFAQEVNLTLVTSLMPLCGLECSTTHLIPQGCELTDVRNCLCSNFTLQNDLFLCIESECNPTEQLTITTLAQDYICEGIPQPSRSREIIRIVIIISAFTFPIIALRIYSRITLAHLWWDDWMVLITAAVMIPMSVIPIYNATKGFGQHAWSIKAENILILRQLYYVSQILYTLSQTTVKMSILLLYLRIFPGQRFRFCVKFIMWWFVAVCLSFEIAVIFQCVPVQALFNTAIPAKCIDSVAIIFAGAGFSIFNDVLMIVLPIPSLMQLNFSVKRKIVLVLMFALGSFAVITSIIRLKYIFTFSLRSYDATWENTDVVIWSVLEIYVAMICACIMAIRPLLSKYFPSIFPTVINDSNFSYESNKASLRSPAAHRLTVINWPPNTTSQAIELSSTENLRKLENQRSIEASMGVQKTMQFPMNVGTVAEIERKSSESGGGEGRVGGGRRGDFRNSALDLER